MGNFASSLLACGVTDDDLANWSWTGARANNDAEERLHHEREQRICDEIQKRETKLADLDADSRDLEREAVRHKQNAERHARGSRQYQLSLGNARRALVAVQKKRALMVKERKLVDVANAIVERMRVVDSGGDDSRFIGDLQEFMQAVDLADHTIAADQTRNDAGQVLDRAAGLLNLQEKLVDNFADLEDPESMGAAATMMFGDETLALNDDDDLMRALSQLETEQAPRATAARRDTNYAPMPPRAASSSVATRRDPARPRARLSELGTSAMPPEPQSLSMTPAASRRQALAYQTTGAVRAADDDPFANIF